MLQRPKARRLTLPAMVCAGVAMLVAASATSGPAQADDGEFSLTERSHWAFQPIVRHPAPQVRESRLVANPLDAFLLRALEKEQLSYSAIAEKRDLLRRAKFDLLGLPPTPEEIAEFVVDSRPDAYERLVDRLLSSPHYGEQWGRIWLDLVRYAETAGYNADPLRPNAWKYRDYVIRSFNDDVPFDRFVKEQIAGDELFPEHPEAQIATGYLLMWPDESNASNILLARQDGLNDLTGNVGAVFLGLSVGCAQCHDHKFDAIRQKDFYRLQAFFSGIVRKERVPVGAPDQLEAYRRDEARWLEQTAALRKEFNEIKIAAQKKVGADRRIKFPATVLAAIDTPPEDRDAYQQQLAFWSERQIDIKDTEMLAKMTAEEKERLADLKKQLKDLEKSRPSPPGGLDGLIAGEVQAIPPRTHLLATGSYDKPREEVAPGFLSVLFKDKSSDATFSAPHEQTSGRRIALAKWLTDRSNPLVPRVIVNRVWQGHFGRGLLENANDFGTQTAPPSHPELLDWLAAVFIAAEEQNDAGPRAPGEPAGLGWSLKKLHRLIMTSTAYRQATHRSTAEAEPDNREQVDPGNKLYWHFSRQRLPAESIRDSLLVTAGLLNEDLYGPSVFPELPPDYSKREAWKVSSRPEDRNRRSVYIHAKRNLPYPLLQAFDLPDMHESCARRTQTTVAPQALSLLNSELVLEFAQAMAGRLLTDDPEAEPEKFVRRAYLLAFGRDATESEIQGVTEFLRRQEDVIVPRLGNTEQVLLPRPFPKFLAPARAGALVDFCHALMNANEFLYVD